MEEELTWRTFLKTIIYDAQERQRIASAMGVNQVTLTRWTTGQSSPRPDNLRMLLDILPQHHKQLTVLINKEFPHFFVESTVLNERLREIPSTFYEHVLRTYTCNPLILRPSLVSATIIQEALSHLDPHKSGIMILLAPCVPPSPGQKVRSLRQTLGRGTAPWGNHLEHRMMFFGAEAPAGYAVAKNHTIMVQSTNEIMQFFPHYEITFEQSIVACPIFMAHQLAGCLVVASTQPHYFSQARLEVIQKYADILTLAFEAHEFFDLQDVSLEVMPPYSIQRQHVVRFQQRVTHLMIEARSKNQYITRLQAESLVRKHMEDELLSLIWNDER